MRLLVLGAVVAGLVPACASTEALNRAAGSGGTPIDELPIEKVPVRGFTVGVRWASSSGAALSLTGELLAVDEETLWVARGDRPQEIPRGAIDVVWLELYPSSGAGGLTAWAVVGQLANLSHGLLFVFSGPIWSLLTAPSIVTSAMGNDLKVPLDRLGELRQFARYPAGMPPPWGTLRGATIPAPPTPRPGVGPASRPASRPASPASQPASRPVPERGLESDEPGMSRGRQRGSSR